MMRMEVIKHTGREKKTRTRESGPVFELTDLQHALAVFAVQNVWGCDVIQGIVLQGGRGRM